MASFAGDEGYQGRGYRGRGRGRGGNRGRGRGRFSSSDWYVHEDRNEPDAYQEGEPVQYQQYPAQGRGRGPSHGGAVPPPPPPPAPGAAPARRTPVHTVEEGWQYRDGNNVEHGPFLAARMVKWIDQAYFSPDLKLRKVSRQGAGAWTELQYVLADIKREAALTILPTNTAPGAQHAAPVVPLVVPRPTPPTARPPPPPPPPPPHYPAGYSDNGYSGGRGGGGAFSEPHPARGGRGGGRYGGRGRGPFIPDEGAVDYNAHEQQGGFSGGRGRGGGRFNEYPSGGGGGRFDRGRGRGGFEGRGGRFDRGGGGRRGGGRFDRGGGRGGRGGRGAGPGGSELEVASAVSRLFHGEVSQGAEQPMWRYIDPEGHMQGPFPAKDMESWFQEGYLADPGLRVCGTERKVAPPNLPPPEFFIPLGALIYWVRRGHKFSPITVANVLAKELPEELQKLKDGAEKIAEKKAGADSKEGSSAVSAAGAESAGSTADDSHSDAEEKEEEGAALEEDEEDTQELAATMAKLAVSRVLEEDGKDGDGDAVSAESSTGEN